MSVLKVNNIQDATGNNAISIDSSGNVTLAAGFVPQTAMGRRNLIINGAMQVAQRGTSFTISAAGTASAYCLDRFIVQTNITSGTMAVTQSTDIPSSEVFVSSLKITNNAAVTPTASQSVRFWHTFEGHNFSCLGFGTTGAKSATLSFWVKSSIAGTYSGGLCNSSVDRSFVFEYTISSANTWEYKTVQITAKTDGTWSKDNSLGAYLFIDLGSGSDKNGSAGWQTSYSHKTSNQTAWSGTNGATFYITGVQLEVGSVATPFEHRSYGEELALCQRYYFRTYNLGCSGYASGASQTASTMCPVVFPSTMRAAPSLTANGITSWDSTNVNNSLQYSGSATSADAIVTMQSLGSGRAYWRHNDGSIDFDAEL